ncbi:MAG: HEPN domain-containing protein [Pedobacter sp.]|nr:HEPN domain-containing protein [Pedobacter sp.]
MEHQILQALAQHKAYFRSFIDLLIQKFKPLQIYCFNSNVYFRKHDGVFSLSNSKYEVDYSLLMVTESKTRIDHEVRDYASQMYEDGEIVILCHGQEAIAEAINNNSRFFISVLSTGELIYNHDGINLRGIAKRYDYGQSAVKAHDHFQYRIALAEGFLKGSEECLNNEQYTISTFLLHQAVEQSCIGLIRVCLGYRSEFHNLKRLLQLCNSFSNDPFSYFFNGNKDDEKLFDILMKSYSQARYAKEFKIDKDTAIVLFSRVSGFIDLVANICEGHVIYLEKEAKNVG